MILMPVGDCRTLLIPGQAQYVWSVDRHAAIFGIVNLDGRPAPTAWHRNHTVQCPWCQERTTAATLREAQAIQFPRRQCRDCHGLVATR